MSDSRIRVLTKLAMALIMLAAAMVAYADKVGDGARLYNENCARCHNARPPQEFSQPEWSVIIPHMREKAHMTGTESDAIESFLAITLTANQSATGITAGLEGNDLIARFACAGCHRIGNEGGTVGPDLNGVLARLGADGVSRKLLEPTYNNPSSAMPKFPLDRNQADSIAKALDKFGN